LAGAPDVFHDVAKFAPVVRFGEPIVSVCKSSRFERRPAKGVGFVALLLHYRAVASHHYLHGVVWLTFDVNGFVKNLGFYPGSVYAVFVWRGGIELLNVEVLHVGAIVGETLGDVVVVADDDERGAGESEALGIEIGSGEMNFVPDGGNG